MKNSRMKRILSAIVVSAVPMTAYAQSAWDRNHTYVGYYVCTAEAQAGVNHDAGTGKFAGKLSTNQTSYNIDVVQGYGDNPSHEAVASQYEVKFWAPSAETRRCIQIDGEQRHGVGSVTIERKGKLECLMQGEGDAIDTWVINFTTLRYLRVRESGFVDGEDGSEKGPSVEVGKCQKRV